MSSIRITHACSSPAYLPREARPDPSPAGGIPSSQIFFAMACISQKSVVYLREAV
jgi:hypothetical protein